MDNPEFTNLGFKVSSPFWVLQPFVRAAKKPELTDQPFSTYLRCDIDRLPLSFFSSFCPLGFNLSYGLRNSCNVRDGDSDDVRNVLRRRRSEGLADPVSSGSRI